MAPLTPARRDARGDAESARLWKLAGIGMTMTSEVIGGAIVGWGLDALFGTGPVLLIVFTVLGVGVGMVGFIRSAVGASGEAGREATRRVAEGRAAPLPEAEDGPDAEDGPQPRDTSDRETTP
ncbi:MAG: AtpZ/AtpI family protein [Planctomycetota bacterium]|jgi:F0F1-type ATP synthase assembly protein I